MVNLVSLLAHEVVAAVVDPEIRVVTIADLGILRGVTVDQLSGRVTVTITPTYSGCPAMDVIRTDIRRALRAAGYPDVEIVTVLTPPWSTDWISAAGREKLVAAGIAPPGPAPAPVRICRESAAATPRAARTFPEDPGSRVVALALSVRCPRCGSPDTEQLSRFGSTACKSLWRCRACAEPFDRIKAL